MILLLVLLFVLSAVWYSKFRHGRRRLYSLAEMLPGAPELPFLGHAHRFIGNNESTMITIKEQSYLANHQGGITKLWLGPRLLVLITDANDVDYILKNYLDKGEEFTSVIKKVIGNGMFFSPVPLWRKQRRMAAPAFSKKNLDALTTVFYSSSQESLQSFKELSRTKLNLWPIFAAYGLQSIVKFGVSKVTLNKEDCNRILKAIELMLSIVSARLLRPWLRIEFIFRLSPYYLHYKENLNFGNEYVDSLIKKIRMEPKLVIDEDTEYTALINYLISEDRFAFTDVELREQIMSFAVAAIDTSANIMGFMFLLLSRHKDVQEKAYQEIVNVLGRCDEPPKASDLEQLRYLEQIILETMRLYPPGPIITRHVPEEVTLPSGRILPAGTGVLIGIWGLQRDPKHWGANVEQFDPEHFNEERIKHRHPCAFIPFSHGPRNCIGHKYAIMSMKMATALVLRKYQVACTNKGLIKVQHDLLMKSVDGYNVVLTERDQ